MANMAASLYSEFAAIFACVALIYFLYCVFSRNALYRSQRFAASLIVVGQLIIFAYWSLQLHPVLHRGAYGGSLPFIGAAMTFIGLIAMAQKQSSRTWLWF